MSIRTSRPEALELDDMKAFPRAIQILASMTIAAGLTTASQISQAQDTDIQTVYATEKGACGRGPKSRVEITEGRIAGTGLIAYPDALCTLDGKKSLVVIALDLGNFQDHFKLMLPGRNNWLSLYPCTPVPGLNSAQ